MKNKSKHGTEFKITGNCLKKKEGYLKKKSNGFEFSRTIAKEQYKIMQIR